MADEPKEPKPPQVPRATSPKHPTLCVSSRCQTGRRWRARSSSKSGGSRTTQAARSRADSLDNELVKRFRASLAQRFLEAIEDRKQAILTVDRARLVEISLHLRDEEKFDMLADLTAVDCRSVRSVSTSFSICTRSRRTSG